MNSRVEIVVERYARAPLAHTFDTAVPIDLTTIFRGYGPLPAVVGVRDQTGPWDAAGRERVVQLSDGSEVPERITAYEAPLHFAYTVGPFPRPLGLLASHADGAWWFADTGDGRTHIRWSYTFSLHGPGAPLARLVVPRLWRPYASSVLDLCVSAAEAA